MLKGVQVLRGVAAGMVVAHHFIGTAVEKGWAPPGWSSIVIGNAGVDIFFVISGFIIERTAGGGLGGQSPAAHARTDFLVRRAIRILPLAWIFTLVATLAFLVRGAGDSLHVDPLRWLASMLLLPDPAAVGVEPPEAYVVPVMWSLSYELYFYALFALTLGWRVRWRLTALGAWFVLCAALGAWLKPRHVAAAMLTDALPLEFLAGCVLAQLHRRGLRGPTPAAWALGALGVVILWTDPWAAWNLRVLGWGVPAVLIVAAVVLARREGLPAWAAPAVAAGDASYAWYLSHLAVLSVFQRGVQSLGSGRAWPVGLLFPAFVALSLALAYAVHRLVEQPLRRGLGARWSRRTAAPVRAARGSGSSLPG